MATFTCMNVSQPPPGLRLLPYPGDGAAPFGEFCLVGSFIMIWTYIILFALILGGVGFVIGRYRFKTHVHDMMVRSAQLPIDTLEQMVRARYTNASMWLALMLVAGGILLTWAGVQGATTIRMSLFGEMTTVTPGIAAIFIGLLVWWLGRPARRK